MMPDQEDSDHQRLHTSATQLQFVTGDEGGVRVEKERVAGSPFGALLRRYRLAAGLSQEALAEQARMSINGIGALERGDRRYPYRETVVLLAKALGLAPAATAQLEAAAARPRQPRAGVDGQEASAGEPRAATNLPLQRTSLIGRDADIGNLAEMLRDSRLVTVTGAGGVGKTRTALGVGEALLENTKTEVWVVELAPVQESFVASTVAQVLSVQESANRPLLETLVANLKQKSLLLILDNCEHVIAEAAALAAALLNGCPYLRILATSREPLRITGEQLYRLPSLSLPTPQEASRLTASGAVDYAAILLFIQRAQSIDHRFRLSEDTAPIVADICRRLDGLPLAIELAAARVKILSPRQLRERLDERFRVLTGGSRDALPRQQTIRALIDWSHDLLDEHERTLFRRLGIFVNGFTLEGAVAVASSYDLVERDVFDMLLSLVDKSLVLAQPDGDTLRYRMLESTRAYAVEKLWAAGEREQLASRHLRYLRDRFTELRKHYERTASSTQLSETIAMEVDDVRAALDDGLTRPDVLAGAELLVAISSAWGVVGFDREGVIRIESYLAVLPGGSDLLRARLLVALSNLLQDSQLYDRAAEVAAQAVAHARASGDAATLGFALSIFSFIAIFTERYEEAEAALTEAEAMPAISFPILRFLLQYDRGVLSLVRCDFERATRIFEDLYRQSQEHSRAKMLSCIALCRVDHSRGNTSSAIVRLREILPAIRNGSDRQFLSWALISLAGFLITLDDPLGVEAAAREVIGIATAHPDDASITAAIAYLACVYAQRGEIVRAATLDGYVEATLRKLKFLPEGKGAQEHLSKALRGRLTPDELARLMAQGAVLTADAAIALALADTAV
jgi:predicted ATPase/DNA-binding XRE family transcriptional regulator